jgi:hypothetical protein
VKSMTKAFIIILLFFSSTLKAEMLVEDYQHNKKDKFTQQYLLGVGRGIEWTNSYVKVKNNGKTILCQPEKYILNLIDFQNIIDSELAQTQSKPNDPIELILLNGMIKKYPCNKSDDRPKK